MAKKPTEEKILDVDASMQGTIAFKDPVNLRINGSFEGRLDARGSLTIGENANVKADIRADRLIVAGKVNGNIIALTSLSVVPPAVIHGNIRTPVLSVDEGAILEGQISMANLQEGESEDSMNVRDVAQYLEVETKVIEDWANQKKIPAHLEKGEWRFNRATIDKWIQDEKVKR